MAFEKNNKNTTCESTLRYYTAAGLVIVWIKNPLVSSLLPTLNGKFMANINYADPVQYKAFIISQNTF